MGGGGSIAVTDSWLYWPRGMPPPHTHTHGYTYTYTYTLCPCHIPASALHAPTPPHPLPPPPTTLPSHSRPWPGHHLRGAQLQGHDQYAEGDDGRAPRPPGWWAWGHTSVLWLPWSCQRACPTLSCAHCAPIRALPLTPPPPLQSILDYFEEHRRVVYLVRVVHVPLAAFWKPLGGWVPPPTCPMCALCSGCQPCVRSSVGCAGVTCGARCPAQRGRWVFVWHVLKHPLHPPPFPTTHTQHPGRMSSGRPSGATLVKTSSWMAPNTARSSASPVTRSSTAM